MPRFDPEDAAIKESVEVTYWEHLPSLGMYIRHEGYGFIALHRDLEHDSRLARVVLAHELGHHMLHDGIYLESSICPRVPGWSPLAVCHAEMQAERWAAERLLPLPFVEEMIARGGCVGEDIIGELADLARVPDRFARWWLDDLERRGVLQKMVTRP